MKGAAERALEKWKHEERPAVAEYTYLKRRPPRAVRPRNRLLHPEFPVCVRFTPRAVEVEVDTETGHVRLLRVVSAHDVGKAINPDSGGGANRRRNRPGAGLRHSGRTSSPGADGYVLTDRFSTYLIPTVLDIPEQVESGARGNSGGKWLPRRPKAWA